MTIPSTDRFDVRNDLAAKARRYEQGPIGFVVYRWIGTSAFLIVLANSLILAESWTRTLGTGEAWTWDLTPVMDTTSVWFWVRHVGLPLWAGLMVWNQVRTLKAWQADPDALVADTAAELEREHLAISDPGWLRGRLRGIVRWSAFAGVLLGALVATALPADALLAGSALATGALSAVGAMAVLVPALWAANAAARGLYLKLASST